MDKTPRQMLLGMALADDARFDNYLVAEQNFQAVSVLRSLYESRQTSFIYLWSKPGVGKSHLLQALCQQRAERNEACMYLSLGQAHELDPRVLEELQNISVLCLDDLEQVLGLPGWEQALFTAFNNAREFGTQLVIAANCPPQKLQVGLADLHSRLQSGLVYQLTALSDEQRVAALRMRAAARGIELQQSVASFISLRANRSMDELMAILDKLDRYSLLEKRSVTIPLVKDLCGW